MGQLEAGPIVVVSFDVGKRSFFTSGKLHNLEQQLCVYTKVIMEKVPLKKKTKTSLSWQEGTV